MNYGLESIIFTNDNRTIEHLSESINVGTVHFNDVPLVNNDLLPVTGRQRSSMVFKGCSRHVLRKYTNFKSISIVRF